jgi:hypothetical protein
LTYHGGPGIPRPVKPRDSAPRYGYRFVCVTGEGCAFLFDDGTADDGADGWAALRAACRKENGTEVIVVTDDPGSIARYLYDNPDTGTGRGMQNRNAIIDKRGGVMPVRSERAYLRTISWPEPGRKAKGRTHYRACPVICAPEWLDTWKHTDDVAERLLWLHGFAGELVRTFTGWGVAIRPTPGAVGARFLRDARFWKQPRRRVPKRINAAARRHLPGNMYAGEFAGRSVSHAYEADMRSAHHQAAAVVEFTDADALWAEGETRTDASRVWRSADDHRYADLIGRPGLFYLRVRVMDIEETLGRRFQLPALREPGEYTVAAWSPEVLHYLTEPGVEVLGVVGAITSRRRPDEIGPGLNGFARWALERIAELDDGTRRRWAKGALLATYGAMAQGPQDSRVIWGTTPTPKSAPGSVLIGGRLVRAHVSRPPKGAEPIYANVIDRGIIEAKVRLEALTFARRIETEGGHVAMIQADAVFIHELEEHRLAVVMAEMESATEWRVTEHHDVRFPAANAVVSDKVDKRPGIPRAGRLPLALFPNDGDTSSGTDPTLANS